MQYALCLVLDRNISIGHLGLSAFQYVSQTQNFFQLTDGALIKNLRLGYSDVFDC